MQWFGLLCLACFVLDLLAIVAGHMLEIRHFAGMHRPTIEAQEAWMQAIHALTATPLLLGPMIFIAWLALRRPIAWWRATVLIIGFTIIMLIVNVLTLIFPTLLFID